MDQDVEGDSGPWSNCRSHAHGGGMQGVFWQEAEVLPAGVVKGAGCDETHIKEKRGGEEEQAVGGREDELRASGSGEKSGGMGEGCQGPQEEAKVEVVIPP